MSTLHPHTHTQVNPVSDRMFQGTIPQRYKSGNEKCHALVLLTRVITLFQLPKI